MQMEPIPTGFFFFTRSGSHPKRGAKEASFIEKKLNKNISTPLTDSWQNFENSAPPSGNFLVHH